MSNFCSVFTEQITFDQLRKKMDKQHPVDWGYTADGPTLKLFDRVFDIHIRLGMVTDIMLKERDCPEVADDLNALEEIMEKAGLKFNWFAHYPDAEKKQLHALPQPFDPFNL